MNIFKRPYTVRRYGKVDWDDENLTEEYSDMQLMLDVQAKTRTNGDALEGQSVQAKLTVYSDVELFPAEPGQQSSGDRLFYMGHWYICKSAVYWGNTMLKHWIAEFEGVEGEGE